MEELKKQTDHIEKLKGKVILLEVENKKLHLEIREKGAKENKEVLKLKERVLELEMENKKFYDNEPYKISLNGTRINMTNVKKSFEKVNKDNELLKTEIVELKERDANIFERLREETKRAFKFGSQAAQLKKRLGGTLCDSEFDSD